MLLVAMIAGAFGILALAGLVLLGVLARSQSLDSDQRPDTGQTVPFTDEVEVVAAWADAAAKAAQEAAVEADRAESQAHQAAAARDIAAQRHRLLLARATAAGEPDQLVQRAALAAYQRGELSVAELNRIWRQAQVTPGPARLAAAVPFGWELRVQEAQRRCEQAAADALRAEQEAHRKALAVAALAEDAQLAESLLVATMRAADSGLAGLLRASWVYPADR